MKAKIHKSITFEKTKVKKVKGMILLLHSFAGSRRTLKRHRQFYLEEGFDVISRDFTFHGTEKVSFHFYWRETWIEQFQEMVDLGIKNQRGPILGAHGFSSFSSVILSWIARHKNKKQKLTYAICENGPFFDADYGRRNASEHVYKIKKEWQKQAFGFLIQLIWDPFYVKRLTLDLKKVAKEKNTKILFLINDKEPVVNSEQILKVASFIPHATHYSFNEEEHLLALKKHEKEYKKVMREFWKKKI